MKDKKFIGMLSVVLTLMVSLILVNQSAFAGSPYDTADEFVDHMEDECTRMGGTFTLIGEGKTSCTDIPVENMVMAEKCIPETFGTEKGIFLMVRNQIIGLKILVMLILGMVTLQNKEWISKVWAKINYIPSEAYLGGTIEIEGMGAPSFLRLKGNGVTYKLPVVPGSIKQLDNGTFTAEFYTIDPFTSQPLVAPGEYRAEVFGKNGSCWFTI